MKTGIIVARFQCSYLHEAHKKLIEFVKNENERVIIFLGTTVTRLTIDNPLDFNSRKEMVLYDYPNVEVFPLPDMKSDEKWINNLDFLIHKYYSVRNSSSNTGNHKTDITLYASRNGFLQCYNGEYMTKFISDIIIEGLSGTSIRKDIHSKPIHTEDWREGVIWASGHKYPTSYQTVDVAIIDSDKKRILLGKKPNENKFRFIGGFCEAGQTLEENIKRECMEEVGGIETNNYKYITSACIDDWRYRKSLDKITTAFFCCNYIFGHPVPKDDIGLVEWFDLSELKEDLFESEHIILFQELLKYLQKK